LPIADCGLKYREAVMTRDELVVRTKRFGLRCMKLAEQLPRSRSGNVVAGQLIRCGTSVGANYRAACRARSRKDFIYRINVVEKEADECAYWMEIVIESGMKPAKLVQPLHAESIELIKIMVASAGTARTNGTAPSHGAADSNGAARSIRNPQSAIRNR
jgi:four helix bundle protein